MELYDDYVAEQRTVKNHQNAAYGSRAPWEGIWQDRWKLLSFVEGLGFDIVEEFDTDIVVSEGAKNLANLLLVFEVNRGIEGWNWKKKK